MTPPTNFFATKRAWSKLKDQILDEYLTPYLTKITTSGRPTRLADCFAGKGQFDDGTPGSPLIIARHIATQKNRNPNVDLRGVFIERKYAADLRVNLTSFPNCEVLDQDYEQSIQFFLSQPPNTERSYFFYVDPYGIKNLDFRYFEQLRNLRFKSLEILLNLNTTGFLREGCHVLKLQREVPDWAIDLDYEQDNKNSSVRMDAIAGGEYWQSILADFQKGAICFSEAEERFTTEYTGRLQAILPLVVNVPIKESSNRLPKYRLIFATNHNEGLILMTETMHKAWRSLLANETGAQLILFNDEQWARTRGKPIETLIWEETGISTELSTLLVLLIQKNGIEHAPTAYIAAIRKHEGKMFQVNREPDTTPTGKQARNFDYRRVHITVQRKAYDQEFL